MPRLLRILGAVMAAIWTLLYVIIASGLLGTAMPFIVGFLVPLFAGTLLLIALSYLFAAVVEISGGGSPPSTFVQVCAVIYLLACTLIAVVAVGYAVGFVVVFVLAVPPASSLELILSVAALVAFLFPHAFQVLIAYVLGAIFAPAAPFNSTTGTGGADLPAECFFRGTLIGMNTAMNAACGVMLYGLLFAPIATMGSSSTASYITAVATQALVIILVLTLALANFATSLASATVAPPMPAAGFVQGSVEAFAGWLSWLMPMSWFYCAYGWWAFYQSWIGHFLSLLAPGSFPPVTWAIVAMRLDASAGVITTDGGSQGNKVASAYNCGCFSFVSLARAGIVATRQHEAGHHLHLAAFGSFFHLIDGVNENGSGPISAQGILAYGERVAESNVSPSRGRPEVPVWR